MLGTEKVAFVTTGSHLPGMPTCLSANPSLRMVGSGTASSQLQFGKRMEVVRGRVVGEMGDVDGRVGTFQIRDE